MGPTLAEQASNAVDPNALLVYQGMDVYGSYFPGSDKDIGLKNWASHILSRFPGVRVVMLEREREKNPPVCPTCHKNVPRCPNCQSDMRGTEEKRVDTLIATDMIGSAWSDQYDVAVLLSSDRDFVPVVDFLNSRGIKTIHGAFPPSGASLTQACWASISIPQIIDQLRRT